MISVFFCVVFVVVVLNKSFNSGRLVIIFVLFVFLTGNNVVNFRS